MRLRSSARRAAQAATALALALGLGAGGAGGAGAAPGAPEGPAPRTTTAPVPAPPQTPEQTPEPVEGVQVQLEQAGPASLRPQDSLQVRARVTNGTAEVLEGARVLLCVNTPVLTTRAAVAAWADGGTAARGDRCLRDPLLAQPLPPGATTTVEMTAPAAELGFSGTWGPRGLTVEVVDGDVVDGGYQGLDAVRSFVVWLPEGHAPPPPVELTVLAPVVAGPPDVLSATVPAERLAELTSPGGRLDRVLQASSAPGTVLVLDPAVLSSAAAAPEQGQEWVQRLRERARTQEVLALPQADPDVVALAAAGQGGLYQLAEQQGRRNVQALLGAPARSDLAWPAGGVADPAAVELARTSGRTAVVLSAAAVPDAVAAAGEVPPTRVLLAGGAGIEGVTGLLVDPGMSAVLTAGTTVGAAADPGATAATVARLHADSAVVAAARAGDGGAAQDAPAPSLLLAVPRSWDADPAAASTVLNALASAPWLAPTPLADLLTAQPVTTVALPAGPVEGALPADGVQVAAGAVAEVQRVAGALTDPAARLQQAQASAVAATSAGWRADPDGWRAGLVALAERAGSVSSAVRVVPGSTVNVISSRVDLPVTLVNDLEQDVQVVVSLRSSTPRVRPEGPVEVRLAAGSQQAVTLPVRALASGDTELQVLVSTPQGELLGEPATLSVRVRADWEGRGVAVAAGVLGLVLVLGLVRTVRRGRRDQALPPRSGAAPRAAAGPAPTTDPHDTPHETRHETPHETEVRTDG